MCNIINNGSGEFECLTHRKWFNSTKTAPTTCPTGRKFAKAGTPVLPAKYATLSHVLHICPAGRASEIPAGTPVRVFGGNFSVNGTLIGSFERGTGAYAGEMAVILRDDTNEYAEYWTGPSMGRNYVVMPK